VTRLDAKRRLILWAIAMSALAIVLMWILYLVREILLLIYVSALFAIGFSPVVRLIERQRLLPVGTRRFPRWSAILVLYVVIIGTLVLIGAMILPPLIDQARALWAALPDMFDRAQNWLVQRGVLDRKLTLREAVQRAEGPSTDAVGTVLGALVGFVGGLFGLFTILILTFYFLVEAASLRESFLRLFVRSRRPQVAAALREVTFKVSSWLTGQLMLGGIIGVTAAIGLWLLGIPYFYVLALIAAVGELIPVVGPLLAAIPAIAVAATVSLQKVALVIIFYIVQQQFENHVLVPKVMERQVGVSAVTVIVALLMGGSLLGIVGAILAVPTAAILQVVLQEVLSRHEALAPDA
jgi:predicted PurR-regulated permease PerM